MPIDLRKASDPPEGCGCLDVSEVLCIGSEIWWIDGGRVRNETIVRVVVEQIRVGWKTNTTYWTESGTEIVAGFGSYDELIDSLKKQRSAP